MTDVDRRSFMGSMGALFAGFRIAGASEVDLIKATDDFMEDPDCEEEESSESSTTCICSWSGTPCCPHGSHNGRSCPGRDCPQWDDCQPY